MKFFLGRKSMSFRTQRIVAKDVDLRPSATKVLRRKPWINFGQNEKWKEYSWHIHSKRFPAICYYRPV